MHGHAAPPPEQPLVLVGRDGQRQVVMAADAAAQAAGLRVGMAATQAQVLVADLRIEPHDAAGDTEALDRLAMWALQLYAPIAASDPPDGLVIDMTGAAHLKGGEQAVLADLVERLAKAGTMGRAAIADSWGAAHALARFGAKPLTVSRAGASRADLVELPIMALRVAPQIVSGLRTLGFEQIGEVLARPRAPLTLRFGPQLGRRLDQALGLLAEPIEPIRPPEIIHVRRSFSEPISAAETIARYIGLLVEALCDKLAEHGLGARRLDLICHRVDGQDQAVRVGTATPVREAKRLTRLLTDKIETIDPGFGIEILDLAASLAEPIGPRQMGSSLIDEAGRDISDLVDVLINRVGAARLYRIAPVPSDVPERAEQRIAPLAPDSGLSWPVLWPRPSRLMATPERIEAVAMLPDHPPISFTWRGVRRRVRRADGPERVYGEWWRRDAELEAVRDYFQVEDEGGERYWIYRAGDGNDPATGSQTWFLHGIFG